MTAPYDIFHKQSDGSLIWREAAETMERVEKRVQEFMTKSPGEYLVMNQRTGQKFVIKHNASEAGAAPYSDASSAASA